MALDQLLEEVFESGLLSTDEIFGVVMYWKTLGKSPMMFPTNSRVHQFIDLRYESDFDENGIIYWIGTKVNASPNPSDTARFGPLFRTCFYDRTRRDDEK
jgi:hypothetical protein